MVTDDVAHICVLMKLLCWMVQIHYTKCMLRGRTLQHEHIHYSLHHAHVGYPRLYQVPNMRHMRALRPSNLEVLDSFATDILHANNSSSSSNSSGDQGQSSRVPPSSLEKNVSPESAACSGDGSSSSLRFVLGPAMPPSAEPSPPQKMQDDAGACDDSLPAEVQVFPSDQRSDQCLLRGTRHSL